MATGTNKTMHLSLRGEQRIDSLISAPLIAASKANAMMFTGQTRFLLENCFNRREDDRYEPVMIEMVLHTSSLKTDEKQGGLTISKTGMTFQVPLISLLPLNHLAVEQIKIDFGLDITSMGKGPTRQEHIQEGKLKEVLRQDTVLNGRISTRNDTNDRSQSKNSDTDTHLHVSVEMKSAPLPKGVQSLLDLYNRSITPLSADNGLPSETKADDTSSASE